MGGKGGGKLSSITFPQLISSDRKKNYITKIMKMSNNYEPTSSDTMRKRFKLFDKVPFQKKIDK